jgi:acyl-[acyl-carrier-protein] desaturase
MVPWSRARDYDGRPVACNPNIGPAARSALLVNLLTEDNLPYYFRTLSLVGDGTAWNSWVRRWTAEEGRHSIVIRDYLVVTRSIDPVELERARMHQVSCGITPSIPDFPVALAYTSIQELATRIAHRNTGKLLCDDAGFRIMRRVAADENRHYLFYRDLARAAFEIAPSAMMLALDSVVSSFAMPGTGIPNFAHHARAIAAAGVYNLAVHHDQILVPVVLQHLDIEHLADLTPEAETARDHTLQHISRVARAANWVRQQNSHASARSAPL